MSTALIVNFIFAAIAVAFFLQFLNSRKNVQIHLEHYEEQLTNEIEKRKESELQYQNQIQSLRVNSPPQIIGSEESKSVIDSLVAEVSNLRKEKDQEVKSRLEAEKQIDLALQKTTDIQKRIDDWKTIQEANLKDITNVIIKGDNDLYERLTIQYHTESEIIRNRVDDTVKNIDDHLERITKQVQFLNVYNSDSNKESSAAIGMNNDHSSINLEDVLRSAHLQPGIDYFMRHSFPEKVKKSVLCESMIVLDQKNIIIIDIKSARFFLELFSGRAKEDGNIEDNFQQKIDRYLTYLTNQKYSSNIVNYFAKQQVITPDANVSLLMLVPSEKEVGVFQKLGDKYVQILEDNNINLHSLENFSNLILGE